jgi:hypothetical protein
MEFGQRGQLSIFTLDERENKQKTNFADCPSRKAEHVLVPANLVIERFE